MNELESKVNDLIEALVSIDRIRSEMIIRETFEIQKTFLDVEKVISNALSLIGDGWEEGIYSLSQVYMSGVIAEEIIAQLLPKYELERITHPKIAIAVFIDHHALGKRIVKSVVEAHGYKIDDFGYGLSVDEIIEKTVENETEVLLISTLMLPSALRIKEIRKRFKELGLKTKIIVGGAPFRLDKDLWQEVGADADGKNASDVIAVIERVVMAQ